MNQVKEVQLNTTLRLDQPVHYPQTPSWLPYAYLEIVFEELREMTQAG